MAGCDDLRLAGEDEGEIRQGRASNGDQGGRRRTGFGRVNDADRGVVTFICLGPRSHRMKGIYSLT